MIYAVICQQTPEKESQAVKRLAEKTIKKVKLSSAIIDPSSLFSHYFMEMCGSLNIPFSIITSNPEFDKNSELAKKARMILFFQKEGDKLSYEKKAEWAAAEADALITIWDGTAGETRAHVMAFEVEGKKIINLNWRLK